MIKNVIREQVSKILGIFYYQNNEQSFLESEICISIFCLFFNFIISLFKCRKKIPNKIFFGFLMMGLFTNLLGIFMQGAFMMKFIKYKVLYGYCSDDLTNELIKIENEKIESSILYSYINFGIDAFIILLNLILGIIYLIINLSNSCSKTNHTSRQPQKNSANNNSNNSKDIIIKQNNKQPLENYFKTTNRNTD